MKIRNVKVSQNADGTADLEFAGGMALVCDDDEGPNIYLVSTQPARNGAYGPAIWYQQPVQLDYLDGELVAPGTPGALTQIVNSAFPAKVSVDWDNSEHCSPPYTPAGDKDINIHRLRMTWQPGLIIPRGAAVVHDDKLSICVKTHVSGEKFDPSLFEDLDGEIDAYGVLAIRNADSEQELGYALVPSHSHDSRHSSWSLGSIEAWFKRACVSEIHCHSIVLHNGTKRQTVRLDENGKLEAKET